MSSFIVYHRSWASRHTNISAVPHIERLNMPRSRYCGLTATRLHLGQPSLNVTSVRMRSTTQSRAHAPIQKSRMTAQHATCPLGWTFAEMAEISDGMWPRGPSWLQSSENRRLCAPRMRRGEDTLYRMLVVYDSQGPESRCELISKCRCSVTIQVCRLSHNYLRVNVA